MKLSMITPPPIICKSKTLFFVFFPFFKKNNKAELFFMFYSYFTFSGKLLLPSAPWVQLLLAGGQVEQTRINDIKGKMVWIDR